MGYDAMSVHNWFMALQRHHVPSKCQELCTLLHGIISQTNEILSHTTVKTADSKKNSFFSEVLYSSNL